MYRPGSGPALVLIPGTFSPCTQWSDVVPLLDKDLRLVIAEMRGHGESWPIPENGSVEMFAVDALRIVDEMRLAQFYVGGHSLWGMIAIEVAELCPESVKGVVSIEGWTNAQAPQDAFQGDVMNTLSAELQARAAEARKQALARWRDDQAKNVSQIWRRWDGYHILSTTDVPILEVWGDRAREKPSLDKLHIPKRDNIQVRWVENASHYLPLERPRGVAEAIKAFVRQVASRHASAS